MTERMRLQRALARAGVGLFERDVPDAERLHLGALEDDPAANDGGPVRHDDHCAPGWLPGRAAAAPPRSAGASRSLPAWRLPLRPGLPGALRGAVEAAGYEVAVALGMALATALAPAAQAAEYGTGPWVKLAVQACAALTLTLFGYGVPLLSNPFGDPLVTGLWSIPLTVAWVIVLTNAINLIDGLDGLAAGVVGAVRDVAGRDDGDGGG